MLKNSQSFKKEGNKLSNLIQEYIQSLKLNDTLLEQAVNAQKAMNGKAPVTFDSQFIFDKACRYLFVNSTAAARSGLQPAEMEGRHWRELGFPSAVLAPLEANIKAVFRTGQVICGEIIIDYPAGTGVTYYEYTLCPLNSASGQCEAVYYIAHDNTAQVKAENDSIQLTRHFSQLIARAPFGVLMADKAGIIIYCNPVYRAFFSSALQGELEGQPISVITLLGNRQYSDLYIGKALSGMESIGEHVVFLERDWIINSFPLRENSGDIIAGVVILQEISEVVKLQKELRKLDSLNIIGEMAAGVAHEIRNPLTAVKGYLQFLQRKVPENIVEQFQIALLELERVETLITDFLSLARNTAARKQSVNLNKIIKDVIPLVAADAIKRDMSIELCLEELLPDQVLDVKEIRQVILNLSCNALDAMDDNGVLSFQTRMSSSEIMLVVSDTGRGIPPDVQEKIFAPFFTTKDKGTGLGLSICANIIKNHSGTIEVETQENKGTSMIIRFPWDEQENKGK
jgi:signal transduction histidine kinase